MARLFAIGLSGLAAGLLAAPARAQTPAALRAQAHAYYAWRDSIHPVATSDAGEHRWDDRLADFRMEQVLAARRHVAALLERVKAMPTATWSRDDRVDWLLFRAQLEGADFFGRSRRPEESDPQVYVNEAANGIFSLLKKDYAPHRDRALAAAARLEKVPAMLTLARANLTQPVRLYARLAIDAARGGDDLYTTSLMTLADSLSEPERARLVEARDGALARHPRLRRLARPAAGHHARLEADGRGALQLPAEARAPAALDAKQIAMLGEVELARYRGLEAMLKDPSFASPDPARSKHVPADQAEFLAAYEARLDEIDPTFSAPTTWSRSRPTWASSSIRQLPRGLQADQPRRLHEPAGHLRPAIPAASTSSRPTTRRAATSTFAPPSRIRARSSATKAFPGISCSSRSPTISPTRSAASTATTPSSKGGRCTARRC